MEHSRIGSRYRQSIFGLAIALALVAAACGDTTDDTTTTSPDAATTLADDTPLDTTTTTADPGPEGPASGGTIVIGVNQETAGWDPPNGLIGFPGRLVNHLVYGQLTMARPDGTYVPYLAETIESNDDFTVWTITLRDGVTFHDGTPYNAEAVKFHLDRMAAPESSLATAFEDYESVDVVDELTVTVTLTEPHARFTEALADSAGNVVSPTAVEALGEEFNNSPVGAGPYRLVEWVRDDHLILERYDDFIFDDRAWADRIIVRPLPDDAARAAALRAGDIDAMLTLNPTDIVSFRDEPGFTLYEIPFGANGLLFQIDSIPDIRVRQAIAMAVDKDALVELVWAGAGEPVNSPLPPDSPWFTHLDYPDFDPEAARALIEEVQSETGDPVTIEIMANVVEADQNFAVALQAQLQAIGIDASLAAVTDANDYVIRYLEGEYQVAIVTVQGIIDPWFEFTRRFHSTALLNGTGFEDEEVDRSLDIGASSTEFEERKPAYDRVQELLADNLIVFYVRSNSYGVVAADHIEGFGTATNPDGSESLGNYFTPILADSIWRSDG